MAAVAFVSILGLVIMVIVSAYTIFEIVAPGVFFASGGRTGASRSLIDTVYVALVLAVVLVSHHRLTAPGIQILDVVKRRRQTPSEPTASS